MEALNLRAMALMVIIMVTMMGNMAKSEQHNVGGSKTSWDPKINFTQWASHEQFHVGDWLYFGYGEKQYSVLEVNNASYVSCNETGFIKNITGGAGRDVFELKEAKTYYFISGGGFCYQGLKVAINVAENLAPSPQHSPKQSHSASDYCLINQTLVVLILVLIWGILFK
ncbi:hypothetical protein RIF29_17742 [Crotalaria pallida]|uniref:Phytocyanin domain-containing protein n=1 Tax=Crotalaria pallida TaxID=3830 RepID=A0AAN9FHU5_CROPI